MRTLKYAILGEISRGSKSGYDLMLTFNEELSHTWYASHSQIYPELRRLVDEGLITYKIEIQGEVLEKKVYTITEKGIKEFKKWLRKEIPLVSAPKDELRLKMYYLDYFEQEDLIAMLMDCKEKQLERVRKFQKSLAKYPEVPEDKEKLGDYLSLQGAYMRAQTYIEWIDLCIRSVHKANETN